MGNNFSYMRISKNIQKFDRQEKKIEAYAKKNNIDILISFKEIVSGAEDFSKRLEWDKLEKIAHIGDCIIFSDLSRFSRCAESGYAKYMQLFNNGIEMIFIDNPNINTFYIKQMYSISEGFSFSQKIQIEDIIKMIILTEFDRVEQERLMISQRTSDGLAASPNKAGRKVGTFDKWSDEMLDDISEYLAMSERGKIAEMMKKYNLSRNTVKKYIKRAIDENLITIDVYKNQ